MSPKKAIEALHKRLRLYHALKTAYYLIIILGLSVMIGGLTYPIYPFSYIGSIFIFVASVFFLRFKGAFKFPTQKDASLSLDAHYCAKERFVTLLELQDQKKRAYIENQLSAVLEGFRVGDICKPLPLPKLFSRLLALILIWGLNLLFLTASLRAPQGEFQSYAKEIRELIEQNRDIPEPLLDSLSELADKLEDQATNEDELLEAIKTAQLEAENTIESLKKSPSPKRTPKKQKRDTQKQEQRAPKNTESKKQGKKGTSKDNNEKKEKENKENRGDNGGSKENKGGKGDKKSGKGDKSSSRSEKSGKGRGQPKSEKKPGQNQNKTENKKKGERGGGKGKSSSKKNRIQRVKEKLKSIEKKIKEKKGSKNKKNSSNRKNTSKSKGSKQSAKTSASKQNQGKKTEEQSPKRGKTRQKASSQKGQKKSERAGEKKNRSSPSETMIKKDSRKRSSPPPKPIPGEKPKRYGDFSGGKDSKKLGSKGFKNVEISGKNEKIDTRYTDKGTLAKHNNEAKYKTEIENIKLSEPDLIKEGYKQEIPLEYKEIIE
ncbi:MAG: hypothetical protein D6808_03360 [Candidatus Dadabacteria bacterium]|nr:MAG: hypothetical protein D6808_03360 [Candidatus Dadabacteria bacterium]